MQPEEDYLRINRASWNNRVDAHMHSAFYDVEGFIAGNSSLKEIELQLLGDVQGKRILHLQCHFGQDTISLSRLGAEVVGVDLSDVAIERARALAATTHADAQFICCDLYALPQHLDAQFDIVFTSYGTIGWLPDMHAWAKIVAQYLKPGGKFVFVEFHPVVWMFDDDFERIAYAYDNKKAIVETEVGTYADRSAEIEQTYVMWNHSLADVLNNIIQCGLQITSFEEFDYSPYNCFKRTEEIAPGKFIIAHLNARIPMVYALTATRPL